ncbi:hypothetical protein [Flavobacterium sp. N1736]|uniref:hypothetical protein n=1 Tax=Flavobacterium sp. N1736 TaxID=2986823 RepID=UPI0022247E70|nr:hypothetical protein [Flavobacterium sp. N1736]
MKKTALTIGLFSLVVVTTSFTSPQIVTSNVAIDGGGQQGINKQKQDVYATSNQLNSLDSKLNSFASDSQSTGSRIKVD